MRIRTSALIILTCNIAINAFVVNKPTPTLKFLSKDTKYVTLNMASTIEHLPQSAVKVNIKVPGSETQSAYNNALKECSKQLTIPGFRKGSKIPAAVIENALAQKGQKNAIRTAALNTLLNKVIEPALKGDHGLEPIGQPTLAEATEELASKFKPGEEMDMVVNCDVWPKLKWKEEFLDTSKYEKPYFGLVGTYKRAPFDEVKFEKALSDLKERYVTLAPKEGDDAKLEMEDACIVNMVGYMAQADGKTKGEPLPNSASGDNVEVVLQTGKYMEGLVEGLVGGQVGQTVEVSVSFPDKLKDKELAGKKAIFDVTINEISTRTYPVVDDEFSNEVREGMTAQGLKDELRKAVDEEEARVSVNARNECMGKALTPRLSIEIPDTILTNQARDKYAVMMTEMRDQGMEDAEIKKLINPENFLKYKKAATSMITNEFKQSFACDEIAKLENVEVSSYDVQEQIEQLREQAKQEGNESEFDEATVRPKVEATLQRRLVFDMLAEKADLTPDFSEEEFDAELMEQLAKDSLKREEEMKAAAATSSSDVVDAEIQDSNNAD